jgi:single-strand DNA-binding protein
MSGINHVVLSGRLTRDPEYFAASGEKKACARYTLAVDRAKEGADFISCVVFDHNAEFAKAHLKQGTKVTVVGKIQTGSFTNKDGQRVYTMDVVIDTHDVMSVSKQ